MKHYSFFHKETGLLAGIGFLTDDESQLVRNIPKDHLPIEGNHDHLSKRVDVASREIVEYQPPAPAADHEWNDSTKRWQLTAAAADRQARHAAARARIAALEASQHRHVREHCLGIAGAAAKLKSIHDEIESLETSIHSKENALNTLEPGS